MIYSICSDAYRFEDKQEREFHNPQVEEDFDDALPTPEYYGEDEYLDDDDPDYCPYPYYEEYDPDAEYYAANDPNDYD